MEQEPKIVIVDDHLLFREGMKLLIEQESMGKVIAEAENGYAFMDLLGNIKPDLVLMDIEMPGMDGLETTRKATALIPNLKVLMVTMLGDKDHYTEAVNAGAMGFILKTSGKHELQRAIKTVIGGETYFSNELLREIIRNFDGKQPVRTWPAPGGLDLTEKEFEVLEFLCKGFTVGEIASTLCRSIKTIEVHRSRLLEKTNSKNTTNLVLFAIRNKLVRI